LPFRSGRRSYWHWSSSFASPAWTSPAFGATALFVQTCAGRMASARAACHLETLVTALAAATTRKGRKWGGLLSRFPG